MDISASSPYGTTSTSNSSSTKDSNTSLSMDDFFKLMAAQLQNQNMMDPVDNSQFMGQMAQFSTLSQMQELSGICKMSYAVSLLGKNVTLSSTNDNGESVLVSGKVDNIGYQSGVPYVEINGGSYLASDVLLVENS